MVDNSDYVKIVRLPSGRLMVVARRIKGEALKRGLTAIVTLCERAEALATRRVELEARYLGQQRAGDAREDAKPLDALVDGACSAIYRACVSAEEAAAISPKKARAARKVREACFPAGLAAVVNVTYEEEFAQLKRIVAQLKLAEIKKALETLALEDEAALLIDKLDDYERAIQHNGKLTYKDVQALRYASHEALCAIVLRVLADLDDLTNAAHVDARSSLLAPLNEQISIVRAELRARIPRTDLDPVTEEPRPIDPVLADD